LVLQRSNEKFRHEGATFVLSSFNMVAENYRFQQSDESAAMASFTAAVTSALENWFVKGHCGGLRQLTIPTLSEEGFFRTFMDAVVQFGLRVESLAARRSTRRPPTEKWLVSLDTWRKINASCRKLRAFDWRWSLSPTLFPRVRRLRETLALSTNTAWTYERFDPETGPALGAPAFRAGYGPLARDTRRLAGMPCSDHAGRRC
jgi:hypothetical protein